MKYSKYLLPAVVAGGVGLVILHGIHQHKNYRHRPSLPKMRIRGAPVPVSSIVDNYKEECHEYLLHAAVSGHEAMEKSHIIEPLLHEHCHRRLPHMIMRGAGHEEMQQHCIAICEKVAHECNLHLKPRCESHTYHHWGGGIHPGILGSASMDYGQGHLPRYHAHALQVNAFNLDYNHAPTPNIMGRLF